MLVLDLAAAVLDADVHAREDPAFVGGEGIAQAAEGDGEVARRIGRGVEMLVNHLVGRREHPAVLPVDAHEILLAFIPQKREPMPRHRENVEVRAVPMRLLVGADRHLRGVRMHGAVRQDEHHVGAACAPLVPGLELEAGEIGNEIGLPHVAAGPHRNELAFAAEIFGRALPFRKIKGVGEHEGFAVEEIEHHGEIVGRGEPRALAAARIEVLIAGVERQSEEALRAPFETVLAPVARLDGRIAVPGEHVHDLLEQVLLRRGFCPRSKIKHEDRHEVAATLEVDDPAIRVEPRPGRGRYGAEIDPEVLGYGNALVRCPAGIGVEQHLRVREVRDGLVHGAPGSMGYRSIRVA